MPPFCLPFISCLVASCENVSFQDCSWCQACSSVMGSFPAGLSHPALKWWWLFPHRERKSWINKGPGETTMSLHLFASPSTLYAGSTGLIVLWEKQWDIGVEATLFLESNCFHHSSKQVWASPLCLWKGTTLVLSPWALWKHHEVLVQSLLVPPRPAA